MLFFRKPKLFRAARSSLVMASNDGHITGLVEAASGIHDDDMATTPAIPEEVFGIGVTDSAYEPLTLTAMGKLFQQEQLTDVMIFAEGQSIACHKFLLAASSPYFHGKFVTEDVLDNNLLEIENISFDTLRLVVSYLYTGRINITVENARDVIPALKLLKLQSAYDTSEQYLMNIADPFNCVALFETARTNGVQSLGNHTLELMAGNVKQVVSSPEFMLLREELVQEFIQDSNLSIPNEDVVFDAVVAWVRHDIDARSHCFLNLVNEVRLQYCSAVHLQEVIAKETLMENLECQKLLCTALMNQNPHSIKQREENTGSSHAPRDGYHSACSVPTLVMIGGTGEPNDKNSSIDCFCLDDIEWRQMKESSLPSSVSEFGTCAVGNDIIISGGQSNQTPVKKCWLLSVSDYKWSPLPDLGTARFSHASTCVGKDVYVIGGNNDSGDVVSSVECLDRVTKKWQPVPRMPEARVHPMSCSFNQYVYVFGGQTSGGSSASEAYAYDANTRAWRNVAGMPYCVSSASAVVFESKIYVIGGYNRRCMCFDPLLNQWTCYSQCTYGHMYGPAVVKSGKILVCGGQNDNADAPVEEFDVSKSSWAKSDIKLPCKLHSHHVFAIEH